MNIKAHILETENDPFVRYLREFAPAEVELTVGETAPANADFEVLIAGVPAKEDLLASGKLKQLVVPWAGAPRPTLEALKEFPQIALHNTHHNASATAEMALALAFAAAKKLIPLDSRLRLGDWRPRYEETGLQELFGRRVLIVGFGHVGRELARMLIGLGLQVSATNRSGRAPDEASDISCAVHASDELDRLLPEAQLLFLTVPLTDETTGLMNAERLALLPDDALLVNVSRGKVVEQEALYNELVSGRLRAGIDVWYNYPKTEEQRANTAPAEFPFGELENVVMVPHMGGDSLDIDRKRALALAEMLQALVDGKEMPNRVDLVKGY